MPASPGDRSAQRLAQHLRHRPDLTESIYRQLLLALHSEGILTIDRAYGEARARVDQQHTATDTTQTPNDGHPPAPPAADAGGDTVVHAAFFDEPPRPDALHSAEQASLAALIEEAASRHFSAERIDELVDLALKRERVHRLEEVANRGDVSFQSLADEVHRFCAETLRERRLPSEDVLGTRAALTRHFISDQLEFIGVAKQHFHIRHFDELVQHIVGPLPGMGRIGGKAGGMVLAHRILSDAEQHTTPFLPIAMPESYFLRSDVVQDFLRYNHLSEYQSQKYKPIEEVARDYPLIRRVFRDSRFPPEVVAALRTVLERVGTHPLIVRSSSLLEDRVGAAFYGKYASVFLPNQGALEQRLVALLRAVAEVYASALSPDPILYRREHHLLDYVEEMAVLIQKVVGFPFGPFFLPAFAGVGFSRNEYRWSPRIRRTDGLLRIVMGLGTRAVDRGGSDFPRLVALGEPTLRPEADVSEVRSVAQRLVDVIDLAQQSMRSVSLGELLSDDLGFPMLDTLVSVYQEGGLYPPPGLLLTGEPHALCITFDKLFRSTPFARRMRTVLGLLEHAFGRPVDVEFACDGRQLYILQCRTQSVSSEAVRVTLPLHIRDDQVLFDAHRLVRTGRVERIEYVVYVDPHRYDALPDRESRLAVARAVGRVNRALPRGSFLLMGPGRWGSRDVRLGVPVRYPDINHAAVLIEIARRRSGFVPAVSFGTHFFQDLVESGIHYLPLYPDQKGNRFHDAFFANSPSQLAQLLPGSAALDDVLRVIHVPSVAGGATIAVAMDGENDEALAYLDGGG